jgi:hypothetical protein
MSQNILIKFSGTTSPNVDNFTIVKSSATSNGISVTSGTNPLNNGGTVTGTIGVFDSNITNTTIATGVSRTELIDGFMVTGITCGDFEVIGASSTGSCLNQEHVNVMIFNDYPEITFNMNYSVPDGDASFFSTLTILGTNGTPNPTTSSLSLTVYETGSYQSSSFLEYDGTYSFTYTTTQYGGSASQTGKQTTLTYTDCTLV